MSEFPDTTGIDHKKLRPIIEKVREKIKNHPVIKKMFNDYDVDLEELDLVPMCFANLNVSARTDHCTIYFNIKLLDDGFEEDDHYMVHELQHFLQQSTGKSPTKGSDSGDYLDNKEEIEGFQRQVEYLSETRDEDKAEEYVDQVLDHHKVYDDDEREERKNKLLELAKGV